MSTDMRGIQQQSLFSSQILISVLVANHSRYRVLASTLPWQELATTANHFRALKVDVKEIIQS
jgi:hypothetical protein